jgi:nucleoside-diphosphate-sugar epimerase
MRALVTGATGFIGGALAAGLAERGWGVRLLVRPESRSKLANPERYYVINGGLDADPALLRVAAAGCDVVFHAAAIRDRWGTSLEEYRRANVEGTRRLLDAAAGRARRFVYVSSVGVLGHPGVQGIDESFPVSTHSGKVGYHSTKAEAEELVRARGGEIEAVVSRPTITYGPGDGDGMVTRLAGMIARGRFLRVGRGTNHVHLTYIDDMVRGLILTGTHPAAAGQTFILAGPRSIAVRDLVGRIERNLGLPPRTAYVPEFVARPIAWAVEAAYRLRARLRPADPAPAPPLTRDKIDTLCVHRGFSSAKAERLLGYVPEVDYDEGLARTLAWISEKSDAACRPTPPRPACPREPVAPSA